MDLGRPWCHPDGRPNVLLEEHQHYCYGCVHDENTCLICGDDYYCKCRGRYKGDKGCRFSEEQICSECWILQRTEGLILRKYMDPFDNLQEGMHTLTIDGETHTFTSKHEMSKLFAKKIEGFTHSKQERIKEAVKHLQDNWDA